MKSKLEIQKFIEQNPDWEVKLQEKPYCITISRDEKFGKRLVMFKYSQIDSDFNNALVRECRGLILDEDTLEAVCVPFFKFGNYGEAYCPEIDWKTCYVTEKLDGSLIKVVRIGDELLWSTNGTIDAYKAPLPEQIGCFAKSFGELAWFAILENYRKDRGLSLSDCIDPDIVAGWMRKKFKEGFTYMFELTSPYNKVVVSWHETKLSFIGCRNNMTGEEIFFGDHELAKVFNTPKVFPLRSVDECVKAASELTLDSEGYVVVDHLFNRIKIKSPVYVAAHHLRGENGIMSYRRALEIVKANEVSEVLSYFPEYSTEFQEIQNRFDNFVTHLENTWSKFQKELVNLHTRKDQAIWIKNNCQSPGFLFAALDGKISSIRDAVFNSPNEKILKILGLKTL